ncbi:c6 zinc finger domain containing protein [Niveomyces insectorum RCEF 264]|uniref:C6 zinc finger domain containing protein n=1 Tax=Niveomyces insectorum RCEF 264 TaxID=1081102 RepID=A0A167ZCQ9_9HYPO|nr:c6 zinc finger domain containing protein [Niveomyces insectorum RCEF 264]
MEKRNPGTNADDVLAQTYPTPANDGQDTASFYNTGPADVNFDHIDPQLAADVAMQTDQGGAGGQVGRVQDGDGGEHAPPAEQEDSYPESHLRALKAEDNEPQAAYNEAHGDDSAYGGASLEQHAGVEQGEGEEHYQNQGQDAHQQQDGQIPGQEQQEDQQQEQQQQQHQETQKQPQQHQPLGGRPLVSVEELQLAAQLSQGLAPMMREANARREEEEYQDVSTADDVGVQNLHDGGSGSGGGSGDGGADEEGGVESGYVGHDVAYQHPHEQQQPHDQQQQQQQQQQHQHQQEQDPNLVQHTDVQGHVAYDASQAVIHMPSSLQMAQMAHQAYASVDHIPPRKRSKVSRACDACRRKKIKCDSVSETAQCTNCQRSHVQCLFSRVPQKRGPSKGYIKELADRINSIEGKLGNQSPSAGADNLDLLAGGRRDSAEAYPGYALNENAKRPYTSISSETPQSSPANSRHAAWASTPRAVHPFQSPPTGSAAVTRTPYSAVSLAPVPQVDAEAPGAAAVARPPLTDMERLLPLTEPVDSQLHEWSDAVFNSYLAAVHPTLPFLASTRTRMLDLLDQCPQLLQHAFLVAVRAATDALVESVPSSTGGGGRAALGLLVQWETEGSPRTTAHDLVHLQTLLLLAIEADSYGPASLKGQHGGLSKTALLARAVAVAYGMDLPAQQVGATAAAAAAAATASPGGADGQAEQFDTEARLALRAWWSLVVLDRWNGVAIGKPLLIPDSTVVLSPGLRPLLGESAYQFTKLSYLLGTSISRLVTEPVLQLASLPRTSAIFGRNLDAAMEMWRVDLPATVTDQSDPVVYLAYWHYRLLACLLQPSVQASEVLWATKAAVALAVATYAPSTAAADQRPTRPIPSPFHHCFLVLPGFVLAELANVDKTHTAALQALNELLEVIGAAPAAPPPPVAGGDDVDGTGGGDEAAAATAGLATRESLWHGPLRRALAERLGPSTKTASAGTDENTTAGAATEGDNSNNNSNNTSSSSAVQGLQHLADLATATVASIAPHDDAAAAATTTGAGPSTVETLLQGSDNYADLGFDPLPLLRAGYLTAVQPAA